MQSSRQAHAQAGLKRTLSIRHLVMLSLGGSIGTGLFLASGAPVSQAGPSGALLAYALIGVMVYFLMTALAELSAFEPVSGSFAVYGEKYVDKGFGLAMGINYSYNWAIAVAVDLVAAQIIMQYWFADVPGWIWSALFLGVMFCINFFSAKSFGEAEFWFASVKVCAVVAFIITGFMLAVGVLPGHDAVGLKNWNLNGDGSFVGGFTAFLGVAMVVGYSFQGTELVGVAAGESKDPDRTIPAAIRTIFWRIILFYVLSIVVIGLLIPHNDPRLLENDLADIALSPFTLVFENAGFPWAAALMNVVVLTTVLSAGNSGMYAATRLVHTLAQEGRLPSTFAKVSASGVPRCSPCGDDSFGFVFSYDLSADAERLRVAAQHHGHGRLHVLAGYRLESLALSPRYAKTGLRSESAAIPIACVSAGYALCICGVPGRSAGTKHRSRI